MSQAKNGDIVKIHYTGKTMQGDIFASSKGDEPLKFKVGGGELLPGIEKAVQGMQEGEQKTITLSPEEGFGNRLEELILVVDKDQFPKDIELELGMEIHVPQPDGSIAILKVIEISNEQVKLDANHPLAGEILTFQLELLEIGSG